MAALEGVIQDSSVGLTLSHNPTTFASSISPSTWFIDSGATDHVTGIGSDFLSYSATTQGRAGVAEGSYAPVAGKGTVQVSPNLSLSSVLHVPCFSFNLISVSALIKKLKCRVTFYPFYCAF